MLLCHSPLAALASSFSVCYVDTGHSAIARQFGVGVWRVLSLPPFANVSDFCVQVACFLVISVLRQLALLVVSSLL